MSIFDLAQLASEFEMLKDFSPKQLAIIAVVYGGQIAAALFAARTIVYGLGRMTGFSHPNHYHRWPRLPWRAPYKVYLAIKKWYEHVFLIGKRGATGGFSGTLAALTMMYRPGKLLVGRAHSHGIGLLQPIGHKIQRHCMFYAMTGSSKTTSLISMLSCWIGSAILIDSKSQIINALAEHDPREWFIFDIYGISGHESICYNPIDTIKEMMALFGPQAAVLWAMRLAEALVVTPAGAKQPYFTNTARQYLAALILHVLTAHPEEEHNLPYIRSLIVKAYVVYDEQGNIISSNQEANELLHRMMINNSAYETIAGGAQAMQSASGDTGGNVLSTLQEQTKWLDIPEVREKMLTTTPGFSLSMFKKSDDCVFAITAPIFSIREELSPLMRTITNFNAYIFESVKEKKGQCLYILDELPSQGTNPTLEAMLAVMRSMGLVVVAISQSVELMRKVFPQSWKSFHGEADLTIWAGGNHEDNKNELSRILGKKNIVEKDKYSGRKTYREVDVMTPDQVGRFLDPDSGNIIVTRANGRPLKLKAPYYFKELPVWKYAADPDHQETLLRRISRFLFDRKGKAKAIPVTEVTVSNDLENPIEPDVSPTPIAKDIPPSNDITYH